MNFEFFSTENGLSAESKQRECVLALESLKPYGYTMGPRLYLTSNHLFLMAKIIGQYHSMSYALRHHSETQFNSLRTEIVPLPFINNTELGNVKPNLYTVLYRVAFDRFFEYLDRLAKQNVFDINNAEDKKLLENLKRLREKYFEQPTALLEHLRTSIEDNEQDRYFGVILHGDFNRNNVMFRYQDDSKEDKVVDIKLIDFQEMRYGSPALDLSFFMFFNTPETLRAEIWMELLKLYHGEMYETLKKTLKGLSDKADIAVVLQQYSFEKFYAHFSRFAFYGVMICLHFLPWLLCSEEECSQLSHYFETDIHGEKFYDISMKAGGDNVNKAVMNVVRYASKMGYMDFL